MLKYNRSKFAITITFIMLMAAIVPASAREKKSGESRAAQAIRSVLEAQVEAWNKGDLEGFMRGYWNSPDLTFFSGGTFTSGWKTTLDRYSNRYQKNGNEMGKLDFTDLKIEMLGSTNAFVRGHWHLKADAGEQGGLFTLVFRKFPQGWKIIHDHTGASS
jgi:ketosteroid isomerase-like protein